MKTALGMTLCATWFIAGPTLAQERPARPQFRLSRQDEDWSVLRTPPAEPDLFDPVKFIPLTPDTRSWLSFGGELRERYEYFDNANWGQGVQDGNGYLLHRFMLHADAHAGEVFRVFTQFKSGLESGREGGPRPTDRDEFDVHQLFLEAKIPAGETRTVDVRAGRQELTFGSQRLVSVREAPNVRLAFDGVRISTTTGTWRLDAFGMRPVRTNPGVFDDGPDPDVNFWGVYGVTAVGFLPGANIDLYYLGLDRETARFAQGTAEEQRHTGGMRFWGKRAGWDWNFEFAYQLGSFGRGDIRAWTAASDTGFTFASTPLKPRISLKADITSGDRDRNDADLQTFNALFPKGAYFAEDGLIGPANHIDVHPAVEFHPADSLTVIVDGAFFWRESAGDGIYNAGLAPVRSGLGGGSYLGTHAGAQADWRIHRRLTWSACYSHFFAGGVLDANPPAGDTIYFSTWVTFRF
jgi:hypothetical protein